MTQNEVKALKVEDKIGYRNFPGDPIIAGTVKQNGPRLDAEGKPISFMNDLLVVGIEGSVATVSWEPVNFPAGIPQLFPASEIGKNL